MLLVGTDEHAPALLAHVELAAEVDDVQHLLAGIHDLGDLVGDDVLVLHRREGVDDAGHQPDLARPRPAALTTCSACRVPFSVTTSQVPSARWPRSTTRVSR